MAVVLRKRKDRHYLRQLWIFLGVVILFFTLVNFSRHLYAILTRRRRQPSAIASLGEKKDAELASSSRPAESHRFSAPFRVAGSVATAFRICSFRWSLWVGPYNLGSPGELAFISLYIAANFIWLFVDTQGLQVNSYKSRAGMIGTAQVPLVIGLATKNNFISWLTGASYQKLNVLHRASARVVFVLLWIHVIGRVVPGLPPHITFDMYHMQAGVASIAALTAGVLFSLPIFRKGVFEFFYVAHNILMGVFVLCGFIHIYKPGYAYYLFPAFILWGLDRLLRLGGILWNNLWRCSNENKAQAIVKLLTPDTIQVSMKRNFSWKFGQHAYICLPQLSGIKSEFHPFTISTIAENLDGSKPEEKEIVFLIRARGGLTSRLKRHASENGTCNVTAYVDGPYGSPPDLHRFSTVILIAGGSGVSYTLPLLLDLIRRSVVGEYSEVVRIKFVWIVRGEGHLSWINKVLSEALPKAHSSLVVDACIYITGAGIPQAINGPSSIFSNEKEIGYVEPEPADTSHAVFHGRPDLRRLVDEEIDSSGGPVSVDIAGPSGLTEGVKAAVSVGSGSPASVLKGRPAVTLHVETFGMGNT